MSFQEQSHGVVQVASVGPDENDNQSQPDNDVHQPETGNVQQPEIGNIDKIREIIFGEHIRDYEKRFVRVEERLTKESVDLREDTRRRFESLEQFIKSEFAALADRLQAEQRTRDEELQGVWRGVHDTSHSLSGKLAELKDQSERAQSNLREQILAQSKELSDDMRRKQDEITEMLQREVADLNHGKTDRSSLATLLTEMAMRLNNDLKLPVSS
jgi:DNA anti-recombination protein RmuC